MAIRAPDGANKSTRRGACSLHRKWNGEMLIVFSKVSLKMDISGEIGKVLFATSFAPADLQGFTIAW